MNKPSDIAAIRTQYAQHSLLESEALADALDQFQLWWDQAMTAALTEVNAMTLATASGDGTPDARIVLLKGFSRQGFTFFTNYESRKGQELEQNPRACLVFFWKELERQVRISGQVVKLTLEESEAYFFSRPAGSQIGAIASHQSQVIGDRQVLERQVQAVEAQKASGQPLQKPEYWGGYRVEANTIEFWQGRPNRLHDRLRYTLLSAGDWKIERLSP